MGWLGERGEEGMKDTAVMKENRSFSSWALYNCSCNHFNRANRFVCRYYNTGLLMPKYTVSAILDTL